MQAVDFSIPDYYVVVFALSILLVCAGNVKAETPSPKSFDRPVKLVLTLSDARLEAEAVDSSSSLSRKSGNKPMADKAQTRLLNVGCGMDVNPFTTDNNSLTSRLVGECKFHYSY